MNEIDQVYQETMEELLYQDTVLELENFMESGGSSKNTSGNSSAIQKVVEKVKAFFAKLKQALSDLFNTKAAKYLEQSDLTDTQKYPEMAKKYKTKNWNLLAKLNNEYYDKIEKAKTEEEVKKLRLEYDRKRRHIMASAGFIITASGITIKQLYKKHKAYSEAVTSKFNSYVKKNGNVGNYKDIKTFKKAVRKGNENIDDTVVFSKSFTNFGKARKYKDAASEAHANIAVKVGITALGTMLTTMGKDIQDALKEDVSIFSSIIHGGGVKEESSVKKAVKKKVGVDKFEGKVKSRLAEAMAEEFM